MPQVFGAEDLDLIRTASLWVESGYSESEIERLTHPDVAAEARSRGLVPHRMGLDPIWIHPETGRQHSLAPLHSGNTTLYRRIKNDVAELRREHPTADEIARKSRSPEEVEADSASAAAETRSKKQQEVAARQRAREQEANRRAKQEREDFSRKYAPFRDMDDIKSAFAARSDKAKATRPDDTVEQFADRLSALPQQTRKQLHQQVFPERYA